MNAWHMRKLNEPICCTISYRQGAKCPLGFDEIEIGKPHKRHLEQLNATGSRVRLGRSSDRGGPLWILMGPDFQRGVENMGKKIGEVAGRAAVGEFLARED